MSKPRRSGERRVLATAIEDWQRAGCRSPTSAATRPTKSQAFFRWRKLIAVRDQRGAAAEATTTRRPVRSPSTFGHRLPPARAALRGVMAGGRVVRVQPASIPLPSLLWVSGGDLSDNRCPLPPSFFCIKTVDIRQELSMALRPGIGRSWPGTIYTANSSSFETLWRPPRSVLGPRRPGLIWYKRPGEKAPSASRLPVPRPTSVEKAHADRGLDLAGIGSAAHAACPATPANPHNRRPPSIVIEYKCRVCIVLRHSAK